jgi:hypothetical protein
MRAFIFLVGALALASACGDSSSNKPKDAGIDSAPPIDASCFTNPQTHYEIINACTTAQKIYKPGKPALENPDGSLPPLP